MKVSRRAVLGAPAVSLAAGAARARDASPAVVVSTWDFGAAANAAAVSARRRGGSGVDMVEAGARVPESDPTTIRWGWAAIPTGTAM